MKAVNLEPLQEFFTTDVEPDYIANLLDQHLFDFIGYVTSDPDFCGNPATCDAIFYLKELRDRIRQCSEQSEEQ